jgi:hypothetical protein
MADTQTSEDISRSAAVGKAIANMAAALSGKTPGISIPGTNASISANA